jgi:hypothetical protein
LKVYHLYFMSCNVPAKARKTFGAAVQGRDPVLVAGHLMHFTSERKLAISHSIGYRTNYTTSKAFAPM